MEHDTTRLQLAAQVEQCRALVDEPVVRQARYLGVEPLDRRAHRRELACADGRAGKPRARRRLAAQERVGARWVERRELGRGVRDLRAREPQQLAVGLTHALEEGDVVLGEREHLRFEREHHLRSERTHRCHDAITNQPTLHSCVLGCESKNHELVTHHHHRSRVYRRRACLAAPRASPRRRSTCEHAWSVAR